MGLSETLLWAVASSMTMSFPNFPAELRLKIWRFCLPHRVAELDIPRYRFFDEEDKENSGGCLLEFTTCANGAPPVLTRVCYESRIVALSRTRRLARGRLTDRPGVRGRKSLWGLDRFLCIA
ncbi:hypothetical protein GE09DRAFT_1089174 [Coniochaeta sp. 2T2.1]|nr:hypothetical protein GE09DRAFT_1089174 [Coniochaeta sp. 2T2.1]